MPFMCCWGMGGYEGSCWGACDEYRDESEGCGDTPRSEPFSDLMRPLM